VPYKPFICVIPDFFPQAAVQPILQTSTYPLTIPSPAAAAEHDFLPY